MFSDTWVYRRVGFASVSVQPSFVAEIVWTPDAHHLVSWARLFPHESLVCKTTYHRMRKHLGGSLDYGEESGCSKAKRVTLRDHTYSYHTDTAITLPHFAALES